MMLGIEIRDRHVTAVAVDARGRVLGRKEAARNLDSGASALSALDAVAGPSDGPVTVGVAAATPDASHDVLRALAGRRYVGSFLHVGPVPSGPRAPGARAWSGPAPGVQAL